MSAVGREACGYHALAATGRKVFEAASYNLTIAYRHMGLSHAAGRSAVG
jgi:hypothetical protein